ncbi:MAG: hypothetical protein A2722_03260 [Candidatus Doudnabacteria bacterium RIFCSPHIGHO2_01_FULL_50_11]|uniref:Uncharacterized protein n=1 Tax=Candidatus Doudnabacteria bacterium RIFCSPHIGHO2_01_FULL_50_11 TaxID=1817828 RepID=A0A1F5PKV0_9BACT|nr:MAG: hypothetical protein A2722_03260 [Candidatus Doudnabacteria bacterium RIFCSPHIGHO2_01_FULL_50_11]HLC45058.1 hypothetical protein [Patescibacteria group bacterium]
MERESSSSKKWDSFGGEEGDFSQLSEGEQESVKYFFRQSVTEFAEKLKRNKEIGGAEEPISPDFALMRQLGRKLSENERKKILSELKTEFPNLPIQEI